MNVSRCARTSRSKIPLRHGLSASANAEVEHDPKQYGAAIAMNMPGAIILIVCKTVLVGEPDINAKWTGYENRDWDYTDSVMHCRRLEIQLWDEAEAKGADPQSFNTQRCNRAIWMEGAKWNEQHKSSSYRFWRGGCPVPIVDTKTGRVLSWQLPSCPTKNGTVVCEQDSAI